MIDFTKDRADIQATYVPSADSGCESRYELYEGLLVIPILGDPTDAPVTVRVHSPFTIRRSAFSYTKGASPPLIPSPANTRTGHTFLSGTISIPAPGGSAEGNLNYKVSGYYSFVLPEHTTINGKLMFDAHPFPTGVDLLGVVSPGHTDAPDLDYGGFYNTWKNQYYDLNLLASNRILG